MIFTNKNDNYKNYSVGDFTYGSPKILEWGEGSTISIGKFCSIAEEVTVFLGGEHRTDWVTTYPFPALLEDWPEAKGITGHPATKGDVIIGNDVWIGYRATILSGIKIGDGAVVGANALVTKNIDPYSIVAGNPAKEIRKRFSEEQINKLLFLKWWEWPIEKIRSNVAVLCSDDLSSLLNLKT